MKSISHTRHSNSSELLRRALTLGAARGSGSYAQCGINGIRLDPCSGLYLCLLQEGDYMCTSSIKFK